MNEIECAVERHETSNGAHVCWSGKFRRGDLWQIVGTYETEAKAWSAVELAVRNLDQTHNGTFA